ncbi:MAG TPA: hypothetical protein VL652_28190 [Kutzneria sp.]|nr:hypothetical protein [Kutzneria sp.]
MTTSTRASCSRTGYHYEIEVADDQVSVLARIGPLRAVVSAWPAPTAPVVLVVQIVPQAQLDARSGPDLSQLSIEESGGVVTTLAVLDGRYLSTEVAGGFTGRVIGMYAGAGTVHFDWFDYQQLEI